MGTRRAGGLEWITIILVIALFAVGFLAMLNATGSPDSWEGPFLDRLRGLNWETVGLHSLWFATGAILAAVLAVMDYRYFARFTPLLYCVCLVVLVVVLVVAEVVYGATSWLKTFFGRTIQPSELAKIALILSLAKQLSMRTRDTGSLSLRDYLMIWVIAGIPLVLVVLQKDLGTATVYLFITVVMLFMSGAKMWMLIATAMAAMGIFAAAWSMDILSTEQQSRILTFLDPGLDPSGAGYNLDKSMMAIGSGQLFGKGFFAPGAMTQLNYIPVQTKDFIYAVIGETFGFVGAAGVMVLFLLLLIRLFTLSGRIREKFGALMIAGVTAMLGFHAIESMGMCIGAMPITGIPLPFISYGGSNMWTNLLGIGLVLSVCMRNPFHRDALRDEGMYFSPEMLRENQIGFGLRSSWQAIMKARREKRERRRKYGG